MFSGILRDVYDCIVWISVVADSPLSDGTDLPSDTGADCPVANVCSPSFIDPDSAILCLSICLHLFMIATKDGVYGATMIRAII